jgi:diguanylate cyclase
MKEFAASSSRKRSREQASVRDVPVGDVERSGTRGDALRFPWRLYRVRIVGMALGAICIAAVLYQNQAHRSTWMLLAMSGLAWPHLAYLLARASTDPARAESRNLIVDSVIGGAWIALMQFNLLPSVLLATLLTFDKINVGIPRLWLWSSLAMLNACLIVALINGLAFRPETSMVEIIACLPMLVVYPLAISAVSHRLLRRVRQQNLELDELSRTDMLTGLSGRRDWQERAGHELRRRHRTGHPACLLMLDIDRFKEINDRFGHTVGDEVIRAVAGVIRDSVRDIDVAGRFGGDEFGIVLEGSRYRQAALVAERIRRGVEWIALQSTPVVHCTVSIGIAEAVDGHEGLVDWITAADSALYRAKSAGRNRVAGPIVISLAPRSAAASGG